MTGLAEGGWRGRKTLFHRNRCVVTAMLLLCVLSLPQRLVVAAPEAVGRTTPDAFEQHFKQAFTSGERGKALALFYWRGVPEATREGVKFLVQRDLEATLRRTGWLPAQAPREFWSGDVRMRSNLTVVARFAAEFEGEGGARHLSMHEVGVVDGVFYIGLAEPVPNVRAVNLKSAGKTRVR